LGREGGGRGGGGMDGYVLDFEDRIGKDRFIVRFGSAVLGLW